MSYNKYQEHPLAVKHGFVAWAMAFALVMFGYNTVVPFFSKVEASIQQASLSAAPAVVEEVEVTELQEEIVFDEALTESPFETATVEEDLVEEIPSETITP